MDAFATLKLLPYINKFLSLFSETQARETIKDISGHLEITHHASNDEFSSKTNFPKSPVTINFDLEVANKLQPNIYSDQADSLLSRTGENSETTGTPAAEDEEEELNFPEIVDPTKKITKSKAKKSKNKSKIPQRQNSKEKKESKQKADVDVEWDFEEMKAGKGQKQRSELEADYSSKRIDEEFLKSESKFLEEDRLRTYDAANGKRKGLFIFSCYFFYSIAITFQYLC